jgi:hypothetical protein
VGLGEAVGAGAGPDDVAAEGEAAEAALIAERDFADPTEESLADFRRVCHPLYSSEPDRRSPKR